MRFTNGLHEDDGACAWVAIATLLFLPFYDYLKCKIIPYNNYLVYLHRNLNELIWQRLYTSILLWANIMA